MDYKIEIVNGQAQATATVSGRVAHDGIPGFIGVAFGEVLAAIGGEAGVAGPPFARYDLCADGFEVEAGFPAAHVVAPAGRVRASTLPGGPMATTTHVGPYAGLAAAYGAIETWLAANGYAPAGAPWESYLDGPEVAEPRTVVSWPCRRAT